MKTALLTGITGQDGSYLAELLLSKGYDVHGIVRRASSFNTGRIDHLLPTGRCSQTAGHLHLHFGDMMDATSLRRVLTLANPDEVYNLAAQSHVKVSFDQPVYTSEVVAIGTVNILEAIRDYRDATQKEVRFYQASSSEMFGSSPPPQSETTPFRPVSPYACAKVYAFHMVRTYRDAYGLHASNGIMFNHESPRRGETFVTRKITRALGRYQARLQDKLYLGNLEAQRDWGYAGDYVKAMWLMLQQEKPDDYVVATGVTQSVDAFLEEALSLAFLEQNRADMVEIDPRYLRPNEIDVLRGDASKAGSQLGWWPEVDVHGLTAMMVDHDRILGKQEAAAKRVVS